MNNLDCTNVIIIDDTQVSCRTPTSGGWRVPVTISRYSQSSTVRLLSYRGPFINPLTLAYAATPTSVTSNLMAPDTYTPQSVRMAGTDFLSPTQTAADVTAQLFYGPWPANF